MLTCIRVHHLLCVPRFIGEGYSDDFGRNMKKIHDWLYEHPQEQIHAVCEPDMVCSCCPNLRDKFCINGNNHVKEKDSELARQLGITEERTYTWKELLEIVEERMTKELFEKSCGSCQWYQMGVCTFEKRRVL